MRHGGEGSFLLAIVSAFISMIFHSGMVALPVAYVITRFIYNKNKKTVSITLSNILISVILLMAGVYFLNRYEGVFLGKMQNVDSLEDIANVSTIGGSDYSRYVGNSNNTLNMLIFTIPRIVFFLFSPLPFQWRGLADIIAFFFSSLFYIVVIYRTLHYLRIYQGGNKVTVIMLFIVALATMFVFAWGVSNAGTATRHRDKMIILYGVLLALSKPANQTGELSK